MAYDSAIISFTTKTDKVDLVQAAHINAVQSELVTIETILGVGVKGDRANVVTRLANALDTDGSLLSGTAFPSPGLPSQPFYRTDLDTFYIRNAANTTWNAMAGNLSNVIFQDNCNPDDVGAVIYEGTDQKSNAAVTPAYRYYRVSSNDTYYKVHVAKWTKISGVATATVRAQIWQFSTSTANVKVDIGTANGNVSGTGSRTTPEWVTFTIDVSGLTNGETYDVTVSLKTVGNNFSYLGSIIIMGS